VHENYVCLQVFKPTDTLCRTAEGDCDAAEYCTGDDIDCPADEVEPETTQCRASAGECDIGEKCDGSTKACPADEKAPSGTECGDYHECNAECNDVFAVSYTPGHDTCDGNGNCDTYTCQQADSYCSDNDPEDGIDTIECGAACDQDSDCDDDNELTIDKCLNDCICQNSEVECIEDNDCDDDNGCTDDRCVANNCVYNNNNDICDDGLFCTIDDQCSGGTCDGDTRDCSANDISAIDTCDNSPDDNPFTLDRRDAFISICDEDLDRCSEGDDNINHECDIEECDAECVVDEDCVSPEDECIDADDDGIENDYVEYSGFGNCTDCSCVGEEPIISKDDEICYDEIARVSGEAGVQMFSVPLMPSSPIDWNDIKNNCEFSEGVDEGIAYYEPDTNEYVFLDDNDRLYPGHGYWVTLDDDCEMIVNGAKFSVKNLGYLGTGQLKDSWNIIGAPSDEVGKFLDVLGTCKRKSGPWGWEDDRYKRTNILEPGQAYWVKVDGVCSLT
jgi:hypothetical protein